MQLFSFEVSSPGFLLILLGGINGPFHSALVSVLAKRDKSESAPIVETVTTLVSAILLAVTVFLTVHIYPPM
jgi:putative peptidoglycan lipid II flippase